jgi:hypothetical protein
VAASPRPDVVELSQAIEPRRCVNRRAGGGLLLAEGWTLAAAVALVSVALVIFWVGHGMTFMQDEWSFIYSRFGGTAEAYLGPHNEHLVLVPAALYKALFATVGIEPYWPYRLMVVTAHIGCVVLLFLVARRSVGRRGAALVVLPFLFFGAAWQVVLWPFNVQWALSVAAFLGLLLLLEHRDTLAEVACAVLLAIAIASSSLGLAIAAGVAVEVLWHPDRWRRIWIPAAPVALYGLWFLQYNRHPAYQGPRNFPPSPGYVFDAAAGAVGALLGVSIGNRVPRVFVLGVDLLTAGAMLIVVWLGFIRRRLTARLAMLLAASMTNWVALAITRSFVDPWESRYLYGGAFMVALIGLELARDRNVGRRLGAVLTAVACTACVLNLGWLIRNAEPRREDATRQAAVLTALELSRGIVDDFFRPRPEPPTEVLVAGSYFNATEAFGESPAMSAGQLADGPEYARAAADQALLRAARPQLIPYVGEARQFINSATRSASPPDRATSQGQRCSTAEPRGREPVRVESTLPPTGLILRTEPPGQGEVRLRRFAAAFPAEAVGAVGPQPLFLSAPLGKSPAPWHVEISSTGRVAACRLPI